MYNALLITMQTLGQIGRVTKVNMLYKVKVIVRGKEWLYHPLCLSPAPGESAPEDIDPQGNVIYLSYNYIIYKKCSSLRSQHFFPVCA